MFGLNFGKYLDFNHFDQTSGANDVIVVRHLNSASIKSGGTTDIASFPLKSTAFHVRFGKFKIFSSYDKVVQVEVNGVKTNAYMKVGEGGIAYWLHPTNHASRQRRRRGQQQRQPNAAGTGEVKAVVNPPGGASETVYTGTVVAGKRPAKQKSVAFNEGSSAAHATGATITGSVVDPNHNVDALVEVAELSRRRISRINMTDSFLIDAAYKEGEVVNSAVAAAAPKPLNSNHNHNTDNRNKPDSGEGTVFQGTIVPPEDDAGMERQKTAEEIISTKKAEDTELAAQLESEGAPLLRGSRDEDHCPPASPDDAVVDAAAASATPPNKDVLAEKLEREEEEEDDEYYLEPMDADDYLEAFGEDRFLKNCSFASSYTSGFGSQAGDAPADAVVSPEKASKEGGEMAAAEAAAHGGRDEFSDDIDELDAALDMMNDDDDMGGGGEDEDASGDDDDDDGAAAGRPEQHHPNHANRGGLYFTRSVFPTEEDLRKLNLRDGRNEVRFIIPSIYYTKMNQSASAAGASNTNSNASNRAGASGGGGAGDDAEKSAASAPDVYENDDVCVSCSVYLWNSTDKIVVSDVDGTITRSDVMGHFYNLIGRGNEWNHEGICSLYSRIHHNGYHFIYVTARSVSQMMPTKRFLFDTTRQDSFALPVGPVFTAPQRFFSALTQEIGKRSHIFKIACLTGIREAFPAEYNSATSLRHKTEEELQALQAKTIQGHAGKAKKGAGGRADAARRETLRYSKTPFFAGFGNRFNDVISYDAVDIPINRIFIIDPQSNLHVCQSRRSFSNLSELVDFTFPPRPLSAFVLAPNSAGSSGAYSPSPTYMGAGPGSSNASSYSLGGGSSYDDREGDFIDEDQRKKVAHNTAFLLNTSNLEMAVGCTPDASNPLYMHNRGTASPSSGGGAVKVVMHCSTPETDAVFSSFNYWDIDPRDLVEDKNKGSTQTSAPAGAAPRSGASPTSARSATGGNSGGQQSAAGAGASGNGFLSFLYGGGGSSGKGGKTPAKESPVLGARQRALMHPDALDYYHDTNVIKGKVVVQPGEATATGTTNANSATLPAIATSSSSGVPTARTDGNDSIPVGTPLMLPPRL